MCCCFFYYKKRNNKDTELWTCKEIDCTDTITTSNNLVIKSGVQSLEKADQNEDLQIVVRHKNICDKHNHPSVELDVIDKMKSVLNIKNRGKNETNSIQAVFQEEQTKFINSKAGILDYEQVTKIFPQFTEIQSALYKQR